MYYEINVNHRGLHLFATAPTSIYNRIDLRNVLKKFIKAFPENEGYQISVYERTETGKPISIEEALNQD